MSYENFSVEKVSAVFDELSAKRAGGFVAEVSKSENLAVSYDSGADTGYVGSSGYSVNYGSYNDGTTVYVYGATDSYVDLSKGSLVYGTAVNIDATYSTGNNILAGNSASNIIWGGSYNNLLIGYYGNDILVGGTGTNFFGYGQYEGNDTILNAGIFDKVVLYDFTLSNIVAAASDGFTVGLGFNTGEILTVDCTAGAGVSPDFVLSDGSTYWYNCVTKQWHQTA